MTKTYTIKNRKFVQRPLSVGQISPLINVLKDIEIPERATALEIISLLEGRFPLLLAVVLSPEDQSAKKKDVAKLEEFFSEGVEIPLAVELVRDFFTMNGNLSESLVAFGESVFKATSVKESAEVSA